MTDDARAAIAALRRSHDALLSLIEPLSAADVRRQSYASEWTIAQVLSHLGSGAVIGKLILSAGTAGRPAPEHEEFLAVWDVWNAKTPDAQAADVAAVDRELVEAFEALDDGQLAGVTVPFAGRQIDVAAFARMRLAEHALHWWDIAVVLDPAAEVDADFAGQILGHLPTVASWAGKPSGEEFTVQFRTTSPDRAFVLSVSDAVVLDEREDQALPVVALPAAALVRLVYGRLDPAHTPEVTEGADRLDSLRAVFPGF
jgi:uncharacterized protein (TIGR03083 family)